MGSVSWMSERALGFKKAVCERCVCVVFSASQLQSLGEGCSLNTSISMRINDFYVRDNVCEVKDPILW